MNLAVRASLVLAALVGVMSVLFYVIGLHKNFMASQVGFLVAAIAINVGVVVWALSQTAATNGYAKQLQHSAVIGLLGGVLILVVSWLLLAVVFPNALAEAREGAIAYMNDVGTPQAERESQIEVLNDATPMSQSLPGGVGTLFTSLVTGAVFAIWKRRK